jgi:hypothetical protein
VMWRSQLRAAAGSAPLPPSGRFPRVRGRPPGGRGASARYAGYPAAARCSFRCPPSPMFCSVCEATSFVVARPGGRDSGGLRAAVADCEYNTLENRNVSPFR